MQEKDSDAVRDQLKRRKRIARIKSTLIFMIVGWIVLSMVLIGCLFARVIALERRVGKMAKAQSAGNAVSDAPDREYMTEQKESIAAGADEGDTQVNELLAWDPVVPPAVGISEEENLAKEGDAHRVYLTFDDGPSEVTMSILDTLKQYDVKATFFVTGCESEEAKAIYKRIVEEGHTLGMHSYSNKYSQLYQSKESFEQDFHALRNYLTEVTGVESRYYRFPGGSSNQISNVSMEYYIHYLNENNVVYYDWNVSAGDAAATAYTPEEMIANVTEDVTRYKTSVVLLHDSADKTATAEMIGPLIDALFAMNAEILPIDEQSDVIQYVKSDSVEVQK